MKKTKTLFSLLFLILLIMISFLPTNNVSAVSGVYNWLDNPSFWASTNLFEDYSFESGIENAGVIYGNWSGSGEPVSGVESHTGNWAYYVDGSETCWYNLTETYQVLGVELENMTIWVWAETNAIPFHLYVYYESGGNDYYTDWHTASGATWQKLNIAAFVDIDPTETIVAIKLWNGGAYDAYFDDGVLSIGVSFGDSQDSIGIATVPWLINGMLPSGYLYNELAEYFGYPPTEYNDFVDLMMAFGRTDDYSCYIQTMDSLYITQYVNYLYSNEVEYIDAYVYSSSGVEVDIFCKVRYSDGSTDTKTKSYDADGSWTYVNFGRSWIESNKFITFVSFGIDSNNDLATFAVYDEGNGVVFFDDVGVWSEIPPDRVRFGYSLTPAPISKSSGSFRAYSGIQYVFNGYVYNLTDGELLSGSGEYIFDSSLDSENGTITNGIFSLQLSKRTYNIYTVENIAITIIYEDEVFIVSIEGCWYPSTSSGDSGDIDEALGNNMLNWVILGATLIAPSFVAAAYGASINPTMGLIGFMGGLTIMGGIDLAVGIITPSYIWIMFLIIIADALIFFGLFRYGRDG